MSTLSPHVSGTGGGLPWAPSVAMLSRVRVGGRGWKSLEECSKWHQALLWLRHQLESWLQARPGPHNLYMMNTGHPLPSRPGTHRWRGTVTV